MCKMLHRISCIVASLLLVVPLLQGQSAYAPEKVYVHLDRTYFAAGETVWLKGYVESAVPVPDSSRFLYVELLDGESGEAALRSKVRLGEEGFAGYLDLPENLPGGHYVLRAYTRWQLNWPESWMFHAPIQIYDGTEPAPAEDDSVVDVSFYPEGGRYFNGEYASIGVKAMAPDGSSVPLTGALYDDRDQYICDFRTVHAGMGLLGFTPKEGRRYRLETQDGRSWTLPEASREGATLQLRRVGDVFVVQMFNHSGAPVILQARGATGSVALSQIDGPSRSLRVPVSATGLQKFVLTDETGRILSERPVFVEDEAMTASMVIDCPSPDYLPRRTWDLNLQLPEGSDIDSAEVSVSVVRGAFRPYQQEGNLTSYMLLGSELRGRIESPEYYFDRRIAASTRQGHLDLLLLIQGWTYYEDARAVSEIQYPKEETQSLQGEVRSVLGGQPRNYTLTLMAPELNYSQVTSINRGSSFLVDSLDFPDGTVFIATVDKGGTRKPYYPVFEAYVAPHITSAYPRLFTKKPLVPRPEEKITAEETDEEPAFTAIDAQHDTIQATVIQAIAPRIRSPFGTSELANIKEKASFISYGHYSLLSYILMTHTNLQQDGDRIINLNTGYLSGGGENFNTVALFVDGHITDWGLAETILMDEVERLSITTYMSSDAFLARSAGGIVLVELGHGSSHSSLRQQTNAAVAMPLGWQQPKAFYNPAYERRRTLEVPDRRNTVYWNPSVRVGPSTPTILKLMTEDRADGPYYLRIEGRTTDGRWISTTKILDP